MEVEETGFSCYSAITRTLVTAKEAAITLQNSIISTIILSATTSNNLNVFTAGSQSNLSPTEVILDTGANCSSAHNSQLLSNISMLQSIDSLAPLILFRKDPWVAYVMHTITRTLLPISYQYQLSLAGVLYSHMTILLTHSSSVIQEDHLYSPGVIMDYIYVTSVIHMFS